MPFFGKRLEILSLTEMSEFKTSLRTGRERQQYHRLIVILISITHIIVSILYSITFCSRHGGYLIVPRIIFRGLSFELYWLDKL